MGFFSSRTSDEQRLANEQHAAIKRAQQQHAERQQAKRQREEDAAYRQLNAARAESEKNVSWWRR